MAHPSTVLLSIERTRKQIRLMEANGARPERIEEELRRLRALRKQLPWLR